MKNKVKSLGRSDAEELISNKHELLKNKIEIHKLRDHFETKISINNESYLDSQQTTFKTEKQLYSRSEETLLKLTQRIPKSRYAYIQKQFLLSLLDKGIDVSTLSQKYWIPKTTLYYFMKKKSNIKEKLQTTNWKF